MKILGNVWFTMSMVFKGVLAVCSLVTTLVTIWFMITAVMVANIAICWLYIMMLAFNNIRHGRNAAVAELFHEYLLNTWDDVNAIVTFFKSEVIEQPSYVTLSGKLMILAFALLIGAIIWPT